MTEAVTQYYPVPDVPGDKRKTFAQWTYSTQVFQAQFMASEIAYYRVSTLTISQVSEVQD
jgi:beta-mannosidase